MTTERTLLAESPYLPTTPLPANSNLPLGWRVNQQTPGVSINNGNLEIDPRVNPTSPTSYAFLLEIKEQETVIAQSLVFPQNRTYIPREEGRTEPRLGCILNFDSPDATSYQISVFTLDDVANTFPLRTKIFLSRVDISELSTLPASQTQTDIEGINGLSLFMIKQALRLDHNDTFHDELLTGYAQSAALLVDHHCREGIIETDFIRELTIDDPMEPILLDVHPIKEGSLSYSYYQPTDDKNLNYPTPSTPFPMNTKVVSQYKSSIVYPPQDGFPVQSGDFIQISGTLQSESSIPNPLIQAVIIKVGDLYSGKDIMMESSAFNSLIMPYKYTGV